MKVSMQILFDVYRMHLDDVRRAGDALDREIVMGCEMDSARRIGRAFIAATEDDGPIGDAARKVMKGFEWTRG